MGHTKVASAVVGFLLGASVAVPGAGGLLFDGVDDYVTFGQAPTLGLSSFTVETWFSWTGGGQSTTTGAGGVTTAIPLVTKGRGESDGNNRDMNYFLGINAATGTLVADFEEGAAGSSPGLNHPVFGNTGITANTWHHAAVTYDGSTLCLYLDGALDGSLAAGQPPRSDSIQHVGLGTALNSAGTAAGFFSGILDEARIWNYARTPVQITNDMARPLAQATGLVGRWALDETTGLLVADSSGSGLAGTLMSSAPGWTNGYNFSTTLGISLGSPANYTRLFGPTSLVINASVQGTFSRVDFYAGTNQLGTVSASPYQYAWNNVPPGIYRLSAVVVAPGSAVTSAPVHLVVVNAASEWLAFNDYLSGTNTFTNTTTYNVFNSSITNAGPLKDGITGQGLAARVSLTQSNAAAGLGQAPNPGTPAHSWFGSFVDMSASGINVPTNGYMAITFTGLDPSRRYVFKGTGSRGRSDYTNRWLRAELLGADIFVGVPTPGVLTAAQAGELSASQQALCTGNNVDGEMFGWENIAPGSDGTFSVRASQYVGTVPGGSSTGAPYAFGISAFSLEQVYAMDLVNLTMPTNQAQLSTRTNAVLAAVATAPDGVSNVLFYAGTTLIGQDALAPYSVIWSNPPLGMAVLSAVVVDNLGGTATSAPVNVTVVNNLAPLAAVTSPREGAAYATGSSVPISVAASDPDGSLGSVSLYLDGLFWTQWIMPPYSNNWNAVVNGTHKIHAVAMDDGGLRTTSAVVNVTVAPNQAPVPSFAYPTNTTLYATGSVVNLRVNATDVDGTVSSVRLYANDSLLATGAGARLDYTWNNLPAGVYVLKALAIDNLGMAGSTEIQVVAAPPIGSQWVAFNDHFVGTTTHPYATAWNVFGTIYSAPGTAGYLKNIAAGTNVPVYLSITSSSVGQGLDAGAFNAGTPADLTFKGYVDFAVSGTPHSVQMPPGAYITYTFSGLNPNRRYHFTATGVRGNASYTTRYTLVTLEGAISFAGGHTANVVTPAQAPADLASNQVAINIGYNVVGDMCAWNNIDPGPDGTISITTAKYYGNIPGVGLADQTDNAYGFTGIRFEEVIPGTLVSLTSPANNSTNSVPVDLPLKAALYPTGSIASVYFYANNLLLGSDATSPYSLVWSNAYPGTNVLVAVAVEATGVRSTSAPVTAIITGVLTNLAPPVLADVLPARNTTVGNLTNVIVTFSEPVLGVDAADLLINGSPAGGVTGGPAQYVFQFASPPAGVVSFTFAANHGIKDIGTPQYDFDGAHAGWTNLLADLTPPTLAATIPARNVYVTNIIQAQVTFSETVTGVEAGDFLINSAPAFRVTGSGASYTFWFAQPPVLSVVQFSWATNHGIADLAGNPFNHQSTNATWACGQLLPQVTLVASNALCRFFRGYSEASSPIHAWTATGYDDDAWEPGYAPFYYDNDGSYSGNTVLGDMYYGYYSVFLRTPFTVADASILTNVYLRSKSDDAFLAWINGGEVARYNLAAGDLAYNYSTPSSVAEPLTNAYWVVPAGLGYPVTGYNVLAVQAYNQRTDSSDFLIEFELLAYVNDPSVQPPRLASLSPAPGEISEFTNLVVTFSRPVVNVDASDLLINGVPATGLAQNGQTCSFSFSRPAFGPVTVTWVQSHGITDQAVPAQPFVPAASYAYLLLNASAPTVAFQSPAAGAVVSNTLTQVQVIFSKAVAGVDAADLLINGIPASSLTGSGATYEFHFAQPAFGAVQVTWATAHGILDAAAPANVFDGNRASSRWGYTLLDRAGPAVLAQTPPAGSKVTNLTQIEITFDEPFAGLNAADFLVNGVPATNLAVSGQKATFYFAPPNGARIQVAWASGHGITDVADPPNAFQTAAAGATWSYFNNDIQPPVIAAVSPVPGAILRSLSEVEVSFSEPVAGVTPAALQLNGTPALSLSGSGSGPYRFYFAPATNGAAQLSWSSPHGIVDLASPPNALAAAGWSYQVDSNANFEGKVIVSEIMYHPAPEIPEDVRQEWLELHNLSAAAISLNGWKIRRGVNFTFTNVTLAAGGYLAVAADLAAFQARYPGITNVVGGWRGKLSNNGDTLELADAEGNEVNRVAYASEGDWAKKLRGLGERQLSLARTGQVVTAYAFGHEYHSSDQIRIYGADQPEYNGTFTVTPTGPSTFTYTISGSPTAATGVVISRQITTCNNGYCFSGWSWSSLADGLGRSLELVNRQMPNDQGQNWLASRTRYGTPGQPNSVATNHIAPLILGLQHRPLVPRSTNVITITARLVDENLAGVSAQLFYRNAGSSSLPSFTTVAMADDGQHGDGLAGDGVYGAQMAPQANLTIIEFYVAATNALGLGRTWPAVAWDANDNPIQQANAHFQVDDSVYTGNQPFYRFVMTEPERAELRSEHDRDANNENSLNAQMNLTFISIDSTESLCVYNARARNRGAGTRSAWPMNYRVAFPNDRPWKGVSAIHLNTQYTYSQLAGYATGLKSGIDVEAARAVQLLVNGANLANEYLTRTKGSYIQLENTDADYAANHYPDDANGNLYRGSKYPWEANLTYYGTNANVYYGARGHGYYKNSNSSENDWSDLITLSAVMNTNTSSDAVYAQAVRQVANVEQWMRSFAVYALNGSGETAFQTGVGDDYLMYRGIKDPRFILLAHDLDSCFGQTGGAPTNAHLFRMCPFVGYGSANATALNRFMTNAYFAPIYYQQLNDLLNTHFQPGEVARTLDQFLGDWAPDVLESMKTWVTNRHAWVRAQIPLGLTITHSLSTNSGYAYTASPAVALSGQAHAATTRTVRVNGQPATWVAWQARWNTTVTLQPGINRVLVQSFDTNDVETARAALEIWYNNSGGQTVSGTLSADTVWPAASGPYTISASLTVASGATLTIQPGTTVYLASGVNLTVASGGRLVAQGTEAAPIRFTRAPGAATTWGGITINGTDNSPESVFAHVLIDNNNGTAIHSASGTLLLDRVVFGNRVRQYLSLDHSSFLVRDCVFPTGTDYFELVHGSDGIKPGGRGIFLRNFFGAAQSISSDYNDVVDFTGGNRPGSPIVQFINNVFVGSGDDLLDLDGTDAWVEGNLFLNTHMNGSPDTASGVSGGHDGADTSEVTMINNLFFNVDHAAMAKEGNYFTLLHNTIVHQTFQGGQDTDGAVVCLADEGTAQGLGMLLEGNIIYDAEKLVRSQTNAVVVFTNNLMTLAWNGPGGGNVSADPLLLHVPTLAEAAGFTNWAQAQILWAWLKPASNSVADQGGYGAQHPGGVTLAGEPQGTTSRTDAQLTVGINRRSGLPAAGWPDGSGYTHYRWRLDGGAWSAETPITSPIVLSGLPDGEHYVEVVGKNDAGLYQNDPLLGADMQITRSRTWTVSASSPAVRLQEVLASNAGAVSHEGTTPDMVELRNDGPEINLAGMRLTDDPRNPDKYVFPAETMLESAGFLVLYANNADGTSGLHLGFKLNKDGGSLYLYDSLNRSGALLDSMTYGPQLPDLSVGRNASGEWVLCQPTLGAHNAPALVGDPSALRINEWLAAESAAFEADFVEIYNDSPLPVAMGGMQLTDNAIGMPAKWQVPALTFIPAQGFLVFKADGDSAAGPRHLNFRLSADRGEIALLTSNLVLVDLVLYGPQFPDQSFGRTQADARQLAAFTVPTPGSANVLVIPQPTGSALVINELLANNATLANPDGTTPDWVEIYNGLPSMVNLGGLSLTDDISQPTRFVFAPNTLLAAGARLRVICDPNSTNAGPLINTNFALAASGGTLYLLDALDTGVIFDTITYGLQAQDYSLGRVPDGTTNWVLTIPTPELANNAAPLGDASLLRVNEWMPAPASGDDWFEIYNGAAAPVALSGLYLSDSLSNRTKHQIPPFSFLGTGLGSYQVFVADGTAGAGNDHVSFKLDNVQERVVLSRADATVIDAISYYQPQPGVSEGRFPDGATNVVRFVEATSRAKPNYQRITSVAINEIIVRPVAPMEQAVELVNLTADPVDIGNWCLSDDWKNPRKFRIPGGTLLPAHGFLVIYENQLYPSPLDYNAFRLSPLGGELCLSAGDSNGLTGFHVTQDYGVSPSGVALGRYLTSAGEADFVALSATTFGKDSPATVEVFRTGTGTNNAYPLVSPVVLSEIMYQPPDLGTNDNTRDEFIEVRNRSGAPVLLYDPLRPTNTWRLRNAVDFDFPALTLGAGAYLVVVSFDPARDPASLAAFRAAYRLGTNVSVLGPFTGKLANDSDTVELKRPDAPLSNTVPYVMVEKVHYSDSAPWPLVAPNMGVALRRVSLSAYANDPTNWLAAAPTPGFAGGGDADGDGLPDDWEWAHNLAPTNPGDAAADADGDGMSNLQEFLAGTDPSDPQSALRLAPAAGVGTNAIQLSFSAPGGYSYTVQQRTNLVLGTWQKYLDVDAAETNRVIQLNVPPSSSTRFYRVVTPKQP